MRKNLHILAGFYGCQGDPRYLKVSVLTEPKIKAVAKRAGFRIVGTLFHQFKDGGITGLVLVSESHIAIHTWPERNYLTVDIFFCNFTQDNTTKVRRALRDLKILYRPQKVVSREILRD